MSDMIQASMRKEAIEGRKTRSLTSKGKATRAAILEAAHEVFKEMGYYGTSVSEVSRRCGISMGTFYQYFRNKEQVFLELNDLIVSRFMIRARSLSLEEPSLDARLYETLQLLLDHTRHNFAFNRILGESELIDRVTIAYYESLVCGFRDFLRKEVNDGNIRFLDPNMIAYGLLGMCHFHSLDWGDAEGESWSQEQLLHWMMELTSHGRSGPAPWKRCRQWDLLNLPDPEDLHTKNHEPLTKGEKTRKAIFRAAEKVFGRHGVNRANIGEITREAGVAQGTFYVHFESKSDLIEGFVKYLNHEMRREVQRVVARTQDRRDGERAGILAFLRFLCGHREIYRVVPECDMIRRDVALWYYRKIAHGYVRGLEQGIHKGEICNLPAAFLARSLMGITHFIALKWIVWNADARAELPDPLLRDLLEFVLFGIKPS